MKKYFMSTGKGMETQQAIRATISDICDEMCMLTKKINMIDFHIACSRAPTDTFERTTQHRDKLDALNKLASVQAIYRKAKLDLVLK